MNTPVLHRMRTDPVAPDPRLFRRAWTCPAAGGV